MIRAVLLLLVTYSIFGGDLSMGSGGSNSRKVGKLKAFTKFIGKISSRRSLSTSPVADQSTSASTSGSLIELQPHAPGWQRNWVSETLVQTRSKQDDKVIEQDIPSGQGRSDSSTSDIGAQSLSSDREKGKQIAHSSGDVSVQLCESTISNEKTDGSIKSSNEADQADNKSIHNYPIPEGCFTMSDLSGSSDSRSVRSKLYKPYKELGVILAGLTETMEKLGALKLELGTILNVEQAPEERGTQATHSPINQ